MMGQDSGFGAAQARALLDLVAGTDIEELLVEHDGVRVLIRRDPSESLKAGAVSASSEAVGRRADGTEVQIDVALELVPVVSSVVGLFLRGREPGSAALAVEGDTVTVGQPLAVIESLRVPQTVESPAAGTLERILAQDGHPVEYGQTIMLVRPAS
jgi:acetyl-CoA carboxylase biotin carboxyl carrier protein